MAGAEVRLIRPDLATFDAALEDGERWTVFPEALRSTRDGIAANPESTRWGVRLFAAGEPPTVVGWGGFKGPPRDGIVEIGYEIGSDWQGRGLATAATEALVKEAFASPEVATVVAHTLRERNASVRVLEKAGFVFDGEVPEGDVGTAWRFRLDRPGAQFSTK